MIVSPTEEPASLSSLGKGKREGQTGKIVPID
jgi:hypothetical protein